MSFMGIDGDEIKTIKQDYRELERWVKRVRANGYPMTVRDRMRMLSHIKEQRMQRRLTDKIFHKDEALYFLLEERAAGIQREDCVYSESSMNREDFTRALYANFCLIAEDRFGASLDDLAHMFREAMRRDYVD